MTKHFTSFLMMTAIAVEIRGGGAASALKWNRPASGNPLVSQSITVTEDSLLLCWWLGDGLESEDTVATPEAGWDVVEFFGTFVSFATMQMGLASRFVPAGTYSCEWTATPTQGAQIAVMAIAVN